MLNAWLIGSTIVGYLLGSLPFGYLVARAHGVDIFKAGSGNPGATNVKRVLGAKAGNTVFVLDTVKGAVAAGWPMWFLAHAPDARMMGLVGVIGAVLGHSFSIFTRFRGGKGVATTAGGLIVLMPVSCAIGGVVWVLTFLVTRYVSLGSILAAVAVSLAGWLRGHSLPLNIVATILCLFVIVRHRENIARLLAGTENKFARKPPAQP